MLPFIPHSRPTLGKEEIAAVSEVIASGHIAQGEKVDAFESAFSQTIGTSHSAAVNSGTSALHLTLLAMGVGDGDEVIIPSFVCTALVNAVRYTGARPVVSDILSGSYNMDPDDARKKRTRHTKAMIVPHMFGLPADMDALMALDVPIVEDCAQAIGAARDGKPVGSIGHAAVYSFYATKVITTGEGGMVSAGSIQFIQKIKAMRQYDNILVDGVHYNCKMTDIQAAMGIAQLSRLAQFIKKRRNIARRYRKAFESRGMKMPEYVEGHIYYRYVFEPEGDPGGWFAELKEKGVGCEKPVYIPLHRYIGMRESGFPRTEAAWQRAVSIPIYPSLSDAETDRVIQTILKTVGIKA